MIHLLNLKWLQKYKDNKSETQMVFLGVVPLLAAATNEGKLEIIGMQKRGKNAADFGLAFWAGRLSAEISPEAESPQRN